MDRKIDPGLFARLMQMSAPVRKDLLEYIGQGPFAVPPLPDLSRDATDKWCVSRRSHASGDKRGD